MSLLLLFGSAPATISTLTDDFASGPLDSTKWAGAYGNSPVFSGGRVSLNTTAGSTLYSGWLSLNSYDLTGSAAFVQCITAGDQTQTGLETFPLQLEKDVNNKLQWYVTNGTIYARKVVGGAGSTVLSATYSTVTHQWLRIRESGGTIFWDYSSDGTTWNNLTSLANPFAITSVKQEFAIGNFIGQPSTTATFDNFNLAPSFTTVSITKAMTYAVKKTPTAPTKALKYTVKRTAQGIMAIIHTGSYSQDSTSLTQANTDAAVAAIVAAVPNCTHIAIGTFLDFDSTSANNQFSKWATSIHNAGKKMYVRSAGFNDWLGSWGASQYTSADFADHHRTKMVTWIGNNASVFQSGDVFEPVPDELENNSMWNTTYTTIANGAGQAAYNAFITGAIADAQAKFALMSVSGVMCNVVHTNPSASRDVLLPYTVSKLAFLGTDHYPENGLSTATAMASAMSTELTNYVATNFGGKPKHITFGPSVYSQMTESEQAAAITQEIAAMQSVLGGSLVAITLWQFGNQANSPLSRIFEWSGSAWVARQGADSINVAFGTSNSNIRRNLQYVVKKSYSATKSLKYAINRPATAVTKSLKYTIKKTPTALTKSLRYATKAPTALTKSLKYTIARPASALTKQLKYTVKRPATAITKSLKYTVVKPASAITKSLKYAVKTIPTAKTKSLRYAINKPSAITKNLKYTVLKTPSAITRSLRYATAKPIAITKSLKYSVKAPAALTKSLKYTVTKGNAVTKSLKYSVRTTGTAITKSLKYTVRKPVSITKGLIYDIKRPVAITKSLKYTTKTAISITKSLKYGIKLTPSAISKQLKYEVKTATAITKGLTYRVKTSTAVTKTLTYRTKTATAITKSLKYVAGSNSNLVNKSLKYTVKSPVIKTKQLIYDVKTTHTAITKSLAYDIRKATALTKTLVYDVKAPRQITKALKYTIKAPHAAITKPLKYAVVKPASAITRSLKYTVRTPVVLTKSLKYTVKSPHALTKSLTYNISGAGAIISRSLKYAVKRPVVVTKSLRYSIKTGAHNISKTLTYDVRRVNQITKSLTYRVVTTHVLTLALRYNVRRSSAITKALTYRALVPAVPHAISRSLEYDVHIAPQFHDPLILSQRPEPLYLTDSRYVIPMANGDSTIRLGEAANSGALQLDVKSNSIMLE